MLLAHTPNSQSDFNNTFVRSLYAFVPSHQVRHPARHFSRGRQSSYWLLLKSSPCKYLPIYHESVHTTFYFCIYTTKCRPVALSEVYRVHNSYKPISTTTLICHVNISKLFYLIKFNKSFLHRILYIYEISFILKYTVSLSHINGCHELYQQGQCSLDLALITCLHVVSRLSMGGAVKPGPLCVFMAYAGTNLLHFKFLYIILKLNFSH